MLIINNERFSGGLETRQGSHVDRDELRRLFLKLGWGVEVRENLTAMVTHLYISVFSL